MGACFSIEMHHKTVDKAGPGDNVGVNVKKLPKENMPKCGDVMYIKGEAGDEKPPKAVTQFTAAVFVQDHPGQLKAAKKDPKTGAYKGGFTPSIHVRTAKCPCQLLEIKWKKKKSAQTTVKIDNPPYIEAGDEAEITMSCSGPFTVDAYDNCKPLGRMAAMDSNSLIMLGRILSVVQKQD